MESSEWMLVGGIILLFLIMGLFYARTNKGFRKMLFGSLSGIIVLYPASLAVTAAGGSLSMNLFSMTVTSILGIPGVALLVAAQFL